MVVVVVELVVHSSKKEEKMRKANRERGNDQFMRVSFLNTT